MSEPTKNQIIRMLEIKVDFLKAENAELEKENAELLALSAMQDLKASLAIRDLEQQAKGVEDFASKFCGNADTPYQVQLTIDTHTWGDKMRNQAKALKGVSDD